MNAYHTIKPVFTTWELRGKTVLLRTDYNMTYLHTTMVSDFKIRRTLSTIDTLLRNGAAIKIITHQEPVDGHPMSTRPLVDWFISRGYACTFSQDLAAHVPPSTIMICENIRFFEGEKSSDSHARQALAQLLATGIDYYIFEGFGVAHRADTSVTDVQKLFDANTRSIGLLVADEITHLSALSKTAQHPVVALCAGNKKEKLTDILNINAVDQILLGPLLCYEKNLTQGRQKIILPIDFEANSIGKETVAAWQRILSSAQTVICNGLMGLLDSPESLAPFNELLDTIAHSNCYSLIAGGSTTSYVDATNLLDMFSFCSTGGGATLAFLAGANLPGLEPFI